MKLWEEVIRARLNMRVWKQPCTQNKYWEANMYFFLSPMVDQAKTQTNAPSSTMATCIVERMYLIGVRVVDYTDGNPC